jgi:hypothetical protein
MSIINAKSINTDTLMMNSEKKTKVYSVYTFSMSSNIASANKLSLAYHDNKTKNVENRDQGVKDEVLGYI